MRAESGRSVVGKHQARKRWGHLSAFDFFATFVYTFFRFHGW